MMTEFYESFGNDADENKEIPQEILELLNSTLPKNLVYLQDEKGQYYVGPKSEEELVTLKMDFDVEDDVLLEQLKKVPFEKLGEYLYRSQRCVAVKNTRIGNDLQLIPVEQTIGNPLDDEDVSILNTRIFPRELSGPRSLRFESAEGDNVVINIQQQAYDSLTEIRFSNIDFPALTIDMYIYSPIVDVKEETAKTSKDNLSNITFSVNPTRASSITEALIALRIFKGLIEGTTKVNGHVFVSKFTSTDVETHKVTGILDMWSTAAKLEEKLGVHFDPGAAFPAEDVLFFSELKACLIEKKKISWKHPFDHFHISGFNPTIEGGSGEEIIGETPLTFHFLEGPIPCTLLGAEFEIYSLSEMYDLVMTNIEWDNENQTEGEMYVADAPGKTWILKRLYITEADAKRHGVEIESH